MVSLLCCWAVPASAAQDQTYQTRVNLKGHEYLVFGRYLLDSTNTKHDLNKVKCYVDFPLHDHQQLWMAVSNAVNDWDWHLGLIDDDFFGEPGERTYKYGMTNNGTTFEGSSIIFQCQDDYLNIDGIYRSEGYTYTRFRDFYYNENSPAVLSNGANWRRAIIMFSQKKFDNYAIDHTSDETFAIMKRTANHEIGHALGLAHDSRDNGILMYGASGHSLCDYSTYNFSNMTATVPTLHDLMAVYLLYK